MWWCWRGGPSPEAQVSRWSAAQVEKAFVALGKAVEVWELEGDWMARLAEKRPDFVWIGLHGSPGEDGRVQAVLDLLGLPYQGSGVLASAVALDKALAKTVMAAAGVQVPHGACFAKATQAKAFVEEVSQNIGFPCVVKPVDAGSSLGVSVVRKVEDLVAALEAAWAVDKGERALVEAFIAGRELTVGVLGTGAEAVVLGVIEIAGVQADYDFDTKYGQGREVHTHIEPADPVAVRCGALALAAHRALGCAGYSRADLRFDPATDTLALLEVNTLPGFTAASLFPDMAEKRGMDYPTLVRRLTDMGLKS